MKDSATLNEEEARKLLEEIRWRDGICCLRCSEANICPVQGDAQSTRDGLWRCRDCNKQFTVTVNTGMHGTRIPLGLWVLAFQLICDSKRGVSVTEIENILKSVSHKSTWRLAQVISVAMNCYPLEEMLRKKKAKLKIIKKLKSAIHHHTRLSLYPLTLEEALDGFLRTSRISISSGFIAKKEERRTDRNKIKRKKAMDKLSKENKRVKRSREYGLEE